MCLFVIGEDEGFVTLKCFGEITSWNPESELWMWQVRGKSMVWARGWFLAWGELVKVFTPMASGYGLKWPTERPMQGTIERSSNLLKQMRQPPPREVEAMIFKIVSDMGRWNGLRGLEMAHRERVRGG
jgi:hypothetical protein